MFKVIPRSGQARLFLERGAAENFCKEHGGEPLPLIQAFNSKHPIEGWYVNCQIGQALFLDYEKAFSYCAKNYGTIAALTLKT